MKKFIIIILIFLPVIAVSQTSDIVDRIWNYTGGRENYAQIKYMHFDWGVEKEGQMLFKRQHFWDRTTGNYLVKYQDKDNNDIGIYFNINSGHGTVFKNKEKMDAEKSAEYIKNGHAMFINDTYWFLVTVKLEDPGVILKIDKDKSTPQYDVLHLSFEDVGLTPGDQYWLFVDQNGQIDKWQYKLQSGSEAVFDWKMYQDCGMNILLSTRKETPDKKRAIVISDIKFGNEVPEKVFDPLTGQ